MVGSTTPYHLLTPMFIYEIKNKYNKKRYIGQTTRTATIRWNEHLYKLINNTHPNNKLQAAWNKYGKDNFEFNVIYTCVSLDELNKLEELYVARNKDGYNLIAGGTSKKWSVESRLRLSAAKRGKPNGQKGTKRNPFSETLKKRKSLEKRPMGYPDVVNPNGEVYKVESVKDFAKKHNMVFSGLAAIFNKTNACFHYKGWRIATSETIGIKFSLDTYNKRKQISKGRRPAGFPMIQNSSGQIFIIEDTLTSFCKQHQLNPGNVSALINKKKTSYKGWTIYNPMEKSHGKPRQ